MADYSGTPLAKKLRIKEGFRVRLTSAPRNYPDLISPCPENVRMSSTLNKDVDIWHLFSKFLSELQAELEKAMAGIRPDGMIWVSWPKKSSGAETDVSENKIREIALPLGLVDVKVCAVDETWSGLKLVIRRELRNKG